jgi:hypothetical protein
MKLVWNGRRRRFRFVFRSFRHKILNQPGTDKENDSFILFFSGEAE